MSIRAAVRAMTGRLSFEPHVVLGFRKSGKPGVTIHVNYDAYGCYDDPAKLKQLIEDLEIAVRHLEGGK